MKHFGYLVVFSGTLMLAACKNSGGPNSDGAKPADAPVVLSDEIIDKSELPVKEDFEDAAYAAITEDNLDSEVDALDHEILEDEQ